MGRGIQVMAMAAIVVAFVLLADVVSSAQSDDRTVDILLPSQVGDGKPPCCNKCICTKSIPPICQCTDLRSFECHKDCENCVQSPIEIWPPQFECKDWFEGYCTPCTEE